MQTLATIAEAASRAANHRTTHDGQVVAICRICGTQSSGTLPTSSGEPDLFALPSGWSEAPFPGDHKHRDGSTGSLYFCPACNAHRATATVRGALQ